MNSNGFEAQKMREIGQQKTCKSRGFPILWVGIKDEDFHWEEKECPRKTESGVPCKSYRG